MVANATPQATAAATNPSVECLEPVPLATAAAAMAADSAPPENPAPWQDYQTVFTNAKAGMDSVDKAYVQKVVYEMSKDSAHFRNEQRKQAQVDARIAQLRSRSEAIMPAELAAATRSVDQRIASLESRRDLTRTWLHADMDCFYAAVHEAERPELKRVPLAIGGIGMISTANYVARKFGVRSAMPGFIAKRLCPQLVFIPPDFSRYTAAAERVREVFRLLDPDFESGGLDEAYLDITDYCAANGCSGAEAAEELRRRVRERCDGLTCSCGVAPNKMLAKICSDINKPDGQYILPPSRSAIMSFLDTLPTRKIPCIGKVTEQLLRGVLGVSTCGQLLGPQRGRLPLLFTETSAGFFLEAALGLAATRHAPKTDTSLEPGRKGISCERTFRNMSNPREQEAMARQLVESLAADLAAEELEGRNLTLKLKLSTFEVRTRAATLPRHVRTAADMLPTVLRLLRAEGPLELRLMGVRVAALRKVNAAARSPLARLLGLRSKRPAGGPTAAAAAAGAAGTSGAKGGSSHLPPAQGRRPASAPPPGAAPASAGGSHGCGGFGAAATGPASAAATTAAAAAPAAARTTEPGQGSPLRGCWEAGGSEAPLTAGGGGKCGTAGDGGDGGGMVYDAVTAWERGPSVGAAAATAAATAAALPALHGLEKGQTAAGEEAQVVTPRGASGGVGRDSRGCSGFDYDTACGAVASTGDAGGCAGGEAARQDVWCRGVYDEDGYGLDELYEEEDQLEEDAMEGDEDMQRDLDSDWRWCCPDEGSNGPWVTAAGPHLHVRADAAEGPPLKRQRPSSRDVSPSASAATHTTTAAISNTTGTDPWVARSATGTAVPAADTACAGACPEQQHDCRDGLTLVSPSLCGVRDGRGVSSVSEPWEAGGMGPGRHGAGDAARTSDRSGAAASTAPASTWTCRLCTYAHNRRQLLRCEVCDCLRGCTQLPPEPHQQHPQQQQQHPHHQQQRSRERRGSGHGGIESAHGGVPGGGGSGTRGGCGSGTAGRRATAASGRKGQSNGHQPLPQQSGQRHLQQLWASASAAAPAPRAATVTGTTRTPSELGGLQPQRFPSPPPQSSKQQPSKQQQPSSSRCCPECGAAVAAGGWMEHTDWHLAVRLSRAGTA